MKIGNKISKRRKKLGLSQEQAGKLAGVSGATISRLERDLTENISWARLQNIYKALGMEAR